MPYKTFETKEDYEAELKKAAQKEADKYTGYEEFKAKAGKLDALEAKKYPEKVADLEAKLNQANAKLTEHNQIVAEWKERAEQAERDNKKWEIAYQEGVPYELADRIRGNTDEELKADAAALAKLVSPLNQAQTVPQVAPLASTETAKDATGTDAALLAVAEKL